MFSTADVERGPQPQLRALGQSWIILPVPTRMSVSMGRLCVVYGCNITSANKQGISTHGFPKVPHIRRAWINFVKTYRKDFSQPKDGQVICGQHFADDAFADQFTAPLFETELGYRPKRKLKEDAVPSVMPLACTDFQKRLNAAKKTVETADEEVSNRRKRRRKREVMKSIEEMKKTRNEEPGPSNEPCLDASDSEMQEEFADETIIQATQLSLPSSPPVPATVTLGITMADKGVQHATMMKAFRHKKIMARPIYRRSKGTFTRPLMRTVGLQTDMPCQCDATRTFDDTPITCSSPIPTFDDDETIVYACTSSSESGTEDNIDSDFDSDAYSKGDLMSTSMDSVQPDVTDPPHVPPYQERKYIVFNSCLLQLFRHCPCCHSEGRTVVTELGSLVKVDFTCRDCSHSWQWSSQPFIGKMPAGNINLSAAILFSGSLLSKAFRLLDTMNVARFSQTTFYKHQRIYLQPTIIAVWQTAQAELLELLSTMEGKLVLAGDGRSDSPGHCAKYGGFNTMECRINKVIDVQVVQSNEVGNSARCENEGLRRMFNFIEQAGHQVDAIITDRHSQNTKFIREQKPDVKHYFDIWHVAKGLTKKLVPLANKAGMEQIGDWRKSIINHLHWVAASTPDGNGQMMLAKWDSLLDHLVNKHHDHGDLFPACEHAPLTDEERGKDWFALGSTEFEALSRVLDNKYLRKDVQKLSPIHQTSCLEAFHSLMLSFCPKHTSFSYLGMYCRLFLAALHYNENGDRGDAVDEEGNPKLSITFPKAKKGEYSVRKSKGPPTYGYVSRLCQHLFEKLTENPGDLQASLPAKFRDIPDSLAAAYHHPSREEAAATYSTRYPN